ncbi:unnamed protein product [Musa acuminata subsp. malaccensis]|uniref:(wild Malaysian banana) hypothetical protein n=1 Tax=Musa acuminata subsp. malaccensis TaxID=214687 RepID=A0A804IKG6_MUSAM|nr:unnamed protein product [Musa acuminata subsp. malaccensis]
MFIYDYDHCDGVGDVHDTTARGVATGPGAGKERQLGQDLCDLNHGSTQTRWKRCPHCGSSRSTSVSL